MKNENETTGHKGASSRTADSPTENENDQVYWQGHRGGGANDAPDNTVAACMYTWNLGGIPEVDVRTTKDGVPICLHDSTLARTTTAAETIRNTDVDALTFKEVRKWIVGAEFGESFGDERVPSLEKVFERMKGNPERLIYLDIKDIDLKVLGKLIDTCGVNRQILITSPRQSDCRTLKRITRNLRTMIWIGGSPDEIKAKFSEVAESGFSGLDQVQLHLDDHRGEGSFRYHLESDYLKEALLICRRAKIDFEVFPFGIDEASLHTLLDLGIRWYATDEPGRFNKYLTKWQEERKPRRPRPQIRCPPPPDA